MNRRRLLALFSALPGLAWLERGPDRPDRGALQEHRAREAQAALDGPCSTWTTNGNESYDFTFTCVYTTPGQQG